MADADKSLFLWINSFAGESPLFDAAAALLASDYLTPVSFGFILLGLWFAGSDAAARMRWQIGVFAALTAMALANLFVTAINAVYARPRPFDALDGSVTTLFYKPDDPSFPSNAAAASFAIAIAVWTLDRRLGAAMLAAAAIYSAARVYVGVHYPTDILGGVAVALVAVFAAHRLRDLLRPALTAVIRAARAVYLA